MKFKVAPSLKFLSSGGSVSVAISSYTPWWIFTTTNSRKLSRATVKQHRNHKFFHINISYKFAGYAPQIALYLVECVHIVHRINYVHFFFLDMCNHDKPMFGINDGEKICTYHTISNIQFGKSYAILGWSAMNVIFSPLKLSGTKQWEWKNVYTFSRFFIVCRLVSSTKVFLVVGDMHG